MLRRILDAHDGELPDDVFVDFTNTGKEREETLVFVNECSVRWGIPITWLERTLGPHGDDIDEPKDRFRVVTFETASRNGEPFDDIIRERGMVPRPRIRFCTEELKLRVMQNAMRSRGYEEWDRIVGLRYDEPKRVVTIRAAGHERGDVFCPLYDAKVTERDVLSAWKARDFDLGLERWEGNCDLCMLKSLSKRVRIMSDRPDLAAWWLDRDKISGGFSPGNPTYAQLARRASALRLPMVIDDETELCSGGGCTD